MSASGARTHYQVLGVAETAPPETIRAAHRQLARVLHPDRQVDVPDAERALAERRMREVNAAWSVLSDPQRRAEYDRSLRAGRTGQGRTGQGRTAGPAGAPDAPAPEMDLGFAIDEEDLRWDPDEPTLTPFQYHLLRRGPIVAMLVVAVVLFVLTAYAGNSAMNDDDTSVPTTTAGPEECVRLVDPDSRSAVRVACGAAAHARIVTSVEQPLECPSRSRYVVIAGEILCVTTDPSVTANELPGG